MPDAPVPRRLYPQIVDLIAHTQKAIREGTDMEMGPLDDLRKIDAFFLARMGHAKLEADKAFMAIGGLVLWNTLLTLALGAISWAVFFR